MYQWDFFWSSTVCILPLRDWNTRTVFGWSPNRDVCILPLRDWNSPMYGWYRSNNSVCILPLRDWNKAELNTVNSAVEFVSYLWGIETFLSRLQASHRIVFVSYLWGIETSCQWLWYWPWQRLYLTFEGLKHGISKLMFSIKNVCILPLRDWNTDWTYTYNCGRYGLYLTFEGLKRTFKYNCDDGKIWFVSYLWGIETRTLQWERYSHLKWFVSYLWGIETFFFLVTFWNRDAVCILPLRDWNRDEDFEKKHPRLFVSYLWGIETLRWR